MVMKPSTPRRLQPRSAWCTDCGREWKQGWTAADVMVLAKAHALNTRHQVALHSGGRTTTYDGRTPR